MEENIIELPDGVQHTKTLIDEYIVAGREGGISAKDVNTVMQSSLSIFNNVYDDMNGVYESTQNSIDTITSNIDNIENEISDIDTDIKATNSNIDNINNDISALKTTVSGLSTKNYITIKGSLDSIDKLPAQSEESPNNIGDLYFINNDEYIWNGSTWVSLGPLIVTPPYTIKIIIPTSAYNGWQTYGGWDAFNISETDIEKLRNCEATTVVLDDQKNGITATVVASFYKVYEDNVNHDVITFMCPANLSSRSSGKIMVYTISSEYDYSSSSRRKLIWTEK